MCVCGCFSIGQAKLENVSSLWKFMHSCCENISGRANFCVACEETEGVIAANVLDGSSSGCREVSAIAFHVLLPKTSEE